jgi:hypothetical protein
MGLVAALAVGAVLLAPTQAVAADQIEAGEQAIAAAQDSRPDTTTSTPSNSDMSTADSAPADSGSLRDGSAAGSGETVGPADPPASGEPPLSGSTSPETTEPAASTVPDGSQVLAIGDSVLLAAAPELLSTLPGIDIDAQVNRQLWDLPALLADDAGRYRPFVVLGLGTNGTQDAASILGWLDVLGPDRRVVLVNASGPMAWRDDVNRQLVSVAAARPHTCVADWNTAITGHPELLAPDQVHPGEVGGQLYADAVAAAMVACNQ